MKFEMYKDPSGRYRWRLKAANGEIISSGESCRNKQDCQHTVGLLRDTNRNTPFIEV
jgi:uncharacterized protein YegP (UPF0339 family)